jgi:hypothetical protein
MKKILLGVFLAFALLALVLLGQQAWQVYKLTSATAIYLFSETDIKGKDGKPLSRADLLDEILRDAIKRSGQK